MGTHWFFKLFSRFREGVGPGAARDRSEGVRTGPSVNLGGYPK